MRYIISVDSYQPKPKLQWTPTKSNVRHGPPRPFHGVGKGKGGLEVRPPFYTLGERLPNVSLSVSDLKAVSTRRKLLNMVADAAARHGMPIPSVPPARTFQQNVEELRKLAHKQSAIEEAKAQAEAERETLRLKAKASPESYVVCGSCAKVITATLPLFEYKQHGDGCPTKAKLWVDFVSKSERILNFRERAKILEQLGIKPNGVRDEALLTKSDLANEFNASDVAIASAKERGAITYK